MAFDELRSVPLVQILASLGVTTDWKSRKNGEEYYGPCPRCKPKRNQGNFSFDSSRFNCFSCGIKGRGAIDLVKTVKGCGFKEAVSWLEGQAHAQPAQKPVEASSTSVVLTENMPYKSSYEKFKVESDWLRERGLTQETCDHFGVFEYNNPKRQSAYCGKIMLPIRRFSDGEVVGYLARNPHPSDGEPKYVFPKGVLKALEVFGAWHLRETLRQRLPQGARLKTAFLVESPFAVMKFYQMGFPAVSCYGWSVSEQQVQILAALARGWVFLPDSNVRSSALQTLGLLAQHCWVKCPEYPAQDPELLSLEQLDTLFR